MRRTFGAALVAMGLVSMPGCDKFVTVKNPNNLETESVDPERDAALLSNSVYTRFVTTLEYAYVLGAWFTNHARVGDTFPTRNAVGQRNIPDNNAETNGVWNGIGTNIQFAKTTIASLTPAGTAPTLDVARAWWVSGFSIMQMAEYFCEGTIAASATEYRPKMNTVALLDSAISDLTNAQTVIAGLTGLTSAQTTEANNLKNSAQVGIARAHLQAGRKAEAAAAAALVPAGFSYSILHIDNSTQRSLGNQIWSYSESRIAIVVGPEFKTIATGKTDAEAQIGQTSVTGSTIPDPRVKYDSTGRLSQDGVLPFFRQAKHPGWASNMRFASKLEADYITVEANQDPVAMQSFINTRRAAGNQPAYSGATDITSLMKELMLQKSIDFWLEGHEMRDYRRNPTIYPFVLETTPTGATSTYYKPTLGPVGADACWPVPFTEMYRKKKWNDPL
jgi:hypothetical protein